MTIPGSTNLKDIVRRSIAHRHIHSTLNHIIAGSHIQGTVIKIVLKQEHNSIAI